MIGKDEENMAEESPFLDYMKKKNIPLTRKNYLELAMPGVSEDEIGAELESEIPPELNPKVRIVRKAK